ncbi:EH domain-binding protein 1 isoform X7 [Drosophila subpulchrella]|uniref:EH domain-binding protein 1 isoform X7 n=1 Tax=Drosophila subpulchrella TaxID=1486046 RepID=UPI0018A173C5|nr:EH domain-binding protein 1 isoform X7 [Drosophila subpulchrella]
MASVWKRLQRNFKRAAKFQFTASYHDLHLETTAKWRPSNLSIVWTRRSRRVASAPLPWEPDMMNPLVGNISWPVPDNHTISVTLFKDPRTHELEDKDWTFVIEDVTPMGKKRVLANASINMRKYASVESTQQSFTLTLKPVSKKITAASLELTISCVFLREGKATDEDMQSVVSMMSVNNNDVAPLDDLEDIPDFDNCSEITDFTQQLKHLTISLNGCIDLDTPQSVPSLSEDPTPLAESINQLHFELEGDGKGDAASKLDLSTATGATGGLSSADESLKTPNGLQPLVDSTPIKSPGEVRQPPKQTPAEPARSKTMETFDKMVTSTPLEPKASKDDAKPKKKRALFFTEKEDEQDLRVTSLKEESGNDSTKKETTKEENKSTKEASSVVVVVVPQSVKRPELQPLNLKKSYEPSPTPAPAPAPAPASVINESTGSQSGLSTSGPLNNSLKPVEKIVLKTNTPGQDLLEWCKEVTKDYHNVKVTNLTTSWRNGMAFCAIIHHFAPELIDMSQLSAHDVVGNCRIAFDAAESLGIPRVIEPREMNMLTVPDKLGVMTYLHQLRAHFTGKQLKIEQIGSTADESSYVIGDYMSDNLSQSRIVFSHPKTLLLHQNSIDEEIMGHNKSEQLSPTRKKDVKNQILNNSKNILDKVMSPTKDKNSINASQHANQSPPPPQEDSLDEGPPVGGKENISKSVIDPQAANRILTRHKLMSEKAKLMMEKLKLCNSSEAIDEERQARLREQARRLILETRVRSGGSVESPTSPTRPKLERTISPIHNGAEEFYLEQSKKLDAQEPSSPSHRLSGLKGLGVNGSPLQSFNAIVDRVSPKHEKRGDKLSYIESELEALEREQEAIDQKASSLEAKLRAVMGGNPKTEETEEQLLSQWFTLVNKKNALLRRQMQLNILEQEKDLERKHTMLNQELRAAQSVEDWRKTEVQREKERLLLEELMTIVDKRDQLVQHLHNQEKAIEDDQEIAKVLQHVDISDKDKDKCVLQ